MCGICGFWGRPEGLSRQGMLDAIRHRGPDDCGTFERALGDSILWFGHRRLSILDLSAAGHQPMSTPDGRFTVTYNGEIYNFTEVRLELEKIGFSFRSRSDTEVLLAAWAAWGEKALGRLRGMFAFALWDDGERCLWLARDRMGEKPLYYTRQGGRFLFASEVRCLLASDAVGRRMDPDGLDAFLTFGSAADPYSLVKDVRALEAGHWLRVTESAERAGAYWRLADVPESTRGVRREEAVEETGRLLRESVSLTMVSDVPVAVLLSGGIDSSSNAVLLREQGQRDLSTFCVVFEGEDAALSEERWSRLVAERLQTDHRAFAVSGEDARTWVRQAVDDIDQPTFDGVNSYLVCKAVASAGIKVAVTGQGSDELFLGYPTRHPYPYLTLLGRFPGAPLARAAAACLDRAGLARNGKAEKALQTVGSERPEAAAYLVQHSLFSQQGMERLRGEKRPPQVRFVRDQGGSTTLGVYSRLEMTHWLRNTLLRDGDQMSMAHSLELRAPFVDFRLVEFVSSVPGPLRAEPSRRQKPLLVDAVGPGLPAEIADRPKQGFMLPLDRWIKEHLEVEDPALADLGLSRAAVEEVKRQFYSGYWWTRYWALVVLASWAAKNGVGPPPG